MVVLYSNPPPSFTHCSIQFYMHIPRYFQSKLLLPANCMRSSVKQKRKLERNICGSLNRSWHKAPAELMGIRQYLIHPTTDGNRKWNPAYSAESVSLTIRTSSYWPSKNGLSRSQKGILSSYLPKHWLLDFPQLFTCMTFGLFVYKDNPTNM